MLSSFWNVCLGFPEVLDPGQKGVWDLLWACASSATRTPSRPSCSPQSTPPTLCPGLDPHRLQWPHTLTDEFSLADTRQGTMTNMRFFPETFCHLNLLPRRDLLLSRAPVPPTACLEQGGAPGGMLGGSRGPPGSTGHTGLRGTGGRGMPDPRQ